MQYRYKIGLNCLNLLILFWGLSSCGKDDEDQDSVSSAVRKELIGEWLGECRNLENGIYDQVKLQFDHSGSFQFFETVFTDSDCGNASESVLSSSGTFELATEEDANGNFALDLTYQVYQWTPSKQSAAASMNEMQICGEQDWQTGQSRKIAGLSCTYLDGITEVTFPSLGTAVEELILVSGTRAWIGGWFQFGSSRPSSINRERPLRKR